MGIICRPSDGTGSGSPDPIVFIQYVNGWDPMDKMFWSHGLDSLCRNVIPAARVQIPP